MTFVTLGRVTVLHCVRSVPFSRPPSQDPSRDPPISTLYPTLLFSSNGLCLFWLSVTRRCHKSIKRSRAHTNTHTYVLFELRHGASTGALDSIVLQIARDLYCVACGPARIQGAQRLPCTCVHIQHSVLPPVRLPLVHNRMHSIRRRDADDSVADMDLGSGQSNRTHSCGRGRGLRGRVADSQ